jgi:hypothetical protein
MVTEGIDLLGTSHYITYDLAGQILIAAWQQKQLRHHKHYVRGGLPSHDRNTTWPRNADGGIHRHDKGYDRGMEETSIMLS